MSTFDDDHDHDHDQDPDSFFGPGGEEKHRQLVETIEKSASELGLYMQFARIVPADETGKILHVQMNFMIGDLAWSDKVLNPEKAKVDREFRSMTEDLEDQDLEGIKESLENLKKKTQERDE